MYFAVNHKIHEPKAFWTIQKTLPNAPKGLMVMLTFPNTEMDEAVCIWKAKHQADLVFYLDVYLSDYARNVLMVIDSNKVVEVEKYFDFLLNKH